MRLQETPQHVVVVASGGLGSTTLAYWLKAGGASTLTLLWIDYGQRQKAELECLRRTAVGLNVPHAPVVLSSDLQPGSARMAAESKAAAPAKRAIQLRSRNALFLDVATAFARLNEGDVIAFGAHGGPQAVDGLLSTQPEIYVPFMSMSKADIVRMGADLEVPFTNTWSCCRRRPLHCGRCRPCAERKHAFGAAAVPDLTAYDDPAPHSAERTAK